MIVDFFSFVQLFIILYLLKSTHLISYTYTHMQCYMYINIYRNMLYIFYKKYFKIKLQFPIV